MMRKLVAISVVLSAVSASAFGHGGGLDASGCHTNRKTGDYHCHRAGSTGVVPPQTLSAVPSTHPNGIATANSTQSAAVPAVQPQVASICHVGPRGGTYTITKSGKKNYSGC